MTKLRALALALVVCAPLAVAAPAAAGPAHGWDVHCGKSTDEGAGWFNLKGYNVACSVARKTANRYVFGGDESPKDWNCSQVQIGDEVWRTNCTRQKNGEHQHIRFKFGA
jgi:hypothetical protein